MSADVRTERQHPDVRVAIVTGGGRGIGRAISIGLAQAGYTVIVGYNVDARSASSTCRQIRLLGGTAFPFRADVRIEENVARLSAFPVECCGRPATALVNNAAISPSGGVLSSTAEEWKDVVLTDLVGPGLCVKHFAKRMCSRSGSVVNIASTAGLSPLPRAPHYVGAKGGVIAMTKAMALELAPHIRVNAIAPGLVATRKHLCRLQRRSQIIRQIPLGRLVRPSEIARTVLFLLDDHVAITGQTIVVDGGWTVGAQYP